MKNKRIKMDKEQLIKEIREAFKNIELEDGIGLWEAQGLDDYADEKTMLGLRKKDERKNWDNISYEDICRCESSLSFFDAKGIRFHLPKFLILDLLSKEILKDERTPPDVVFTLGYNLDSAYQQERFSLLNSNQIACIIHFLAYKQEGIIQNYKNLYGADNESYFNDVDYETALKASDVWRKKL